MKFSLATCLFVLLGVLSTSVTADHGTINLGTPGETPDFFADEKKKSEQPASNYTFTSFDDLREKIPVQQF